MKKLLIVCAAFTASAGLAQAPSADGASTGGTVQAVPAAGEKDPNEQICRNVESTSTRLGRKRECKTRAEWEAQARRGRSAADQARSN